MINISQTLDYLQLCRKADIEVTSRTHEELSKIVAALEDGPIKDDFMVLLDHPKTGDAYMELLRVCMSLRAMGCIEPNHPSAMVNVRNFQTEILQLSPDDALEFVRPFKFGYLEKYGSYLEYAKITEDLLSSLDLLGGVYTQCNLNRVLALHRVVDGRPLVNDIKTIHTPVYTSSNPA